MDINYPKGFVRSALSFSISVALIGCAATPTDVRQDRGANPTLSSAQWQSNLDRARAEFSRGNYGNAIVLLEAELANRPASVAALNGLGACYDQLGRFDVAQRYYYRALDMAPESSTTLSNIGYSYMQEGRHEEAIQILELALQRDTDNKTAASNLEMARSKLVESGLESTLASEQTQYPGASDPGSGDPVATASPTQSVPGASLVQILDSIAGSQPPVTQQALTQQSVSQQAVTDSADIKTPTSDFEQEPSPDQVVAELFEKAVEQAEAVELSAIPSLPTPASLTSAVSEPNAASVSGLNPSASVAQPETKVAAINPVPVPARSSQAIASAQTNSLTEFMPTAAVIAEPAPVIIEPEPMVEKNTISAAEIPEALATAAADVSEIAAPSASQSTAFPQPQEKIAAIDSIPSPAIAQQPIEPPAAASQMREMAPSPPATPLPLPAELAQEQIPAVGELTAPALMSPPPKIVATEQTNTPTESNVEPFESFESLVLTVLDMNNVPELTLRILESQEPTAAEASDLQESLQEPGSEETNDNQELPQLANEQTADLGGSQKQTPTEQAGDVPQPLPQSSDNAAPMPQLAAAQSEKIEGAPSLDLPIGAAREGEQSATAMTASYNLAVANGNGVRGIARATSTWLDNEQLKIAEVVDADNFNYSQTVIKHRPEFAQLAMEMAAQMAVNCDIQVSDDLLDGVDMQLILGQDFASNVNVKDGWLSFDNESVSQLGEELRLEIANGNGVDGMAGRLGNYLQDKGSSVVTLTNAEHFSYSESTLFYRPGRRVAAEELLLALPVKNVSLEESANLSDKVDAKLLLGRDFVPYDIGPGEI